MAKTNNLVLTIRNIDVYGDYGTEIRVYLEKGASDYDTTADYSSAIGLPLDQYSYAGATYFTLRERNVRPWLPELEIGYSAYLQGEIIYEFDLDAPPPKLFLEVDSSYSDIAFTIEVGAYVDGIYGVLGGPVSVLGVTAGAIDINLAPIQMEPDTRTGEVTLELGSPDSDYGDFGPIAVYTQRPAVRDLPTAVYSSIYPMTNGWIGPVSSFSAVRDDIPSWYTGSIGFIPVVGGVSQPIDPLNPPSTLYVETEGNGYYADLRVSMVVDGKYGVLGQSPYALRQNTGVEEVQLKPIQYSLDTDDNPTVIRIYDRSASYRSIGKYSVYVEESQDYESPTTLYTSFNSLTVSNDQSGGGYVTSFIYHLANSEPTYAVIEVGFVPIVGGVPQPITLQNLPDEVLITVDQNYAGGVVEIGHYISGVYHILGSTTVDGNNQYAATIAIPLENPLDKTPRLHMRIVGAGDGDVGVVGVYEKGAIEPYEKLTAYRAAFSFETDSGQLPMPEAEYVTFLFLESLTASGSPAYYESKFTPIEGGVLAPIDPKQPPASVYVETIYSLCGGVIQIGAYVGGDFVVMGSTPVLPYYRWEVYSVALTPIIGVPDGDGQMFLRFAGFSEPSTLDDLPYISVFTGTTPTGEQATTEYTDGAGVGTYESGIAPQIPAYVSVIYLWTVDFQAQNNEPTFRAILYTNDVKDEMDMPNPPPSINALVAGHSAGGKLQIGTFLVDGIFTVLGEQDLPTSTTGEPDIFVIPLTGVEPPAPVRFWTDTVGVVEYVNGEII